MRVVKSTLPGVLVIEPEVFGDSRGFFKESYSQVRYQEIGITENFVQDNHSRSTRGVLRGLHYQLEKAQGKLVFVTHGEAFDVVVDIRKGSENFGQWFGVVLSGENHKQLYVPPGFAHGFCVLSDSADFMYKCTNYYHPQSEKSIRFDDPDIGIEWPIDVSRAILSEKDKHGFFLKEANPEVLPVL